MSEELTYHLEDFDGPLDLLLHLIRVNEMDIMDIPIVEITAQYLTFLHAEQERNLDVAGEFLVMAATLMSIKANYLLPKNDVFQYDEDLAEFVTEEDPRDTLMAQLIEYQRYQQAAGDLREREEERQLQFSRAPMSIPDDIKGAPLPEGLVLRDLQNAFDRLVKKRYQKRVQPRSLQGDNWSIQQQMTKIMSKVDTDHVVTFDQLFSENAVKDEMVTTFMAMLELVRHQHLTIKQTNLFDQIDVSRGKVPYQQEIREDEEADAK